MKLVLATRNEHKVREFARLLPGVEFETPPAGVAFPPETGSTYADNATCKARAAARAMNAPAIADDSGIESEALGGAPGVRSARYAGDNASDAENLSRLREQAPVGSALTYVCAVAYFDPTRTLERVFHGRCEGTVAGRPRGANGFGYDPLFCPADSSVRGRTMAELSDAEKDAISHRGRAARALEEWLRS